MIWLAIDMHEAMMFQAYFLTLWNDMGEWQYATNEVRHFFHLFCQKYCDIFSSIS